MEKIEISVVIPMYNAEKYIKETKSKYLKEII